MKKSYYYRNIRLFIPATLIFSATNSVITSAADAQDIPAEYGMKCVRNDDARKIVIITDIFTIPSDGKQPYELNSIYAPKFHDFIKSEGLIPSNGDCNAFRLEHIQAAQDGEIEYLARMKPFGHKIIRLKGWHPNKPHGLTYIASSGALPAPKLPPPANSTKRESLIVRSLDEAPTKAATKPVAKPAPKPVIKAKPAVAAKPAPKKSTGCKSGDSARGKVCGAVAR